MLTATDMSHHTSLKIQLQEQAAIEICLLFCHAFMFVSWQGVASAHYLRSSQGAGSLLEDSCRKDEALSEDAAGLPLRHLARQTPPLLRSEFLRGETVDKARLRCFESSVSRPRRRPVTCSAPACRRMARRWAA